MITTVTDEQLASSTKQANDTAKRFDRARKTNNLLSMARGNMVSLGINPMGDKQYDEALRKWAPSAVRFLFRLDDVCALTFDAGFMSVWRDVFLPGPASIEGKLLLKRVRLCLYPTGTNFVILLDATFDETWEEPGSTLTVDAAYCDRLVRQLQDSLKNARGDGDDGGTNARAAAYEALHAACFENAGTQEAVRGAGTGTQQV